MHDMKRISWHGKPGQVLHIETEGCIVNIRCSLSDVEGHPITAIEVLCDQDTAPEQWRLIDRGDATVMHVRVARLSRGELKARVREREGLEP